MTEIAQMLKKKAKKDPVQTALEKQETTMESQPKPTTEKQPKPTTENQPKPTTENQPKPTTENHEKPSTENQPKPTTENQAKPTRKRKLKENPNQLPVKQKLKKMVVAKEADAVPNETAPPEKPVINSGKTACPKYKCEECQRVWNNEGPAGFCAASCHQCGWPVYFTKLTNARNYIRASPKYCTTCQTTACKCVNVVPQTTREIDGNESPGAESNDDDF